MKYYIHIYIYTYMTRRRMSEEKADEVSADGGHWK